MDTVKIDKKNAKLIAHRGLSSLERENTCPAFVAAGNRQSYFGIETDVRRTKDGHYVLLHDPTTASHSECDLHPDQCTLEELKQVIFSDVDGSYDRTDIRVPTLREYVRICKKYGKIGVLEFKDADMPREELEDILAIIREEDYMDGIVFIDFCLNNLVMLRDIMPDHPAQWLRWDWQDEYFDELVRHNLDLDIAYGALTKETIDRVKAAGRKINIWTCDNAADAAKYIDYGVDFITTNCLE